MFKLLIVFLNLIFLLTPLYGLSACNDSTSESPSIKKNQATDKISPNLYEVVQALTAHGVEQAETYSSTLIRVNELGEIHVYIHVIEISDRLLSQLEKFEVNIEITNADYNIIQGWVPYNQVENVASIMGVERITPPSYGATRENN